MKRLICALLMALLLAGCLPANRSESTVPTQNAPDTTACSAKPSGYAEGVPEPAPTLPRPEPGIGITMELSQGLVATPGASTVELVIAFPRVEPRENSRSRDCSMLVTVDGQRVGKWSTLCVRSGLEKRVPLEFQFDRYSPDRVAEVCVSLRCGEETLEARTTVELDNYPEELYVELSGDDRPYSIDVLRNQNVVVVYGRDEEGRYTVPVQVWLCSTGYTTPRGDYLLGSKREWGLLFGNVYGQYVCGITGDILFHSVPYARKEKDSLKTEEYNKLGTTASMGCVRLAAGHVKWIYDHCPSGTQVHIYDADQLPVERPEAVLLDPDDPRSGWDPTDPDPLNPWTLEPETPAPTQEESAAVREEDAP